MYVLSKMFNFPNYKKPTYILDMDDRGEKGVWIAITPKIEKAMTFHSLSSAQEAENKLKDFKIIPIKQ